MRFLRWLLVAAATHGATSQPASQPADPSACSADADCVVHCPSAKGCCSSAPCGCTSAYNQSRLADVDAAYAGSCEKPPRCPIVDCRFDEAFGARCVNGRCQAIKGP